MRLFSCAILLALYFPSVQASEPPSLPNSRLTPGATLDVSKEDVCTTGYTRKVRNVPAAVKRNVFDLYDVVYVPKTYEVDHLIPLEIGGSNSVKNLWPEPFDLVWGARVKDALENKLHTMVCVGSLSLDEAQREIAADWIGYYKKYFHTEKPVHEQSGRKKRRSSY